MVGGLECHGLSHSWGSPVREGLVLRLSLSRAGEAQGTVSPLSPPPAPGSCTSLAPAPAAADRQPAPPHLPAPRPARPSAGQPRARAHLVGEAGGQVEEAEGEAVRRPLQIHRSARARRAAAIGRAGDTSPQRAPPLRGRCCRPAAVPGPLRPCRAQGGRSGRSPGTAAAQAALPNGDRPGREDIVPSPLPCGTPAGVLRPAPRHSARERPVT